MQAKGSKAKLYIDFESDYGTVNTVPKAVDMPVNTSAVKSQQSLKDPATITGRRDAVEPIYGNIDVTGQVVVPMETESIGYWLKAAFGAPVTTDGTVSGTYQHVFKLQDDQPSITLQQGFPNVNHYSVYTGVKLSKLSLSFGGDEELTMQMDVMGAKEAVQSTSFDTTPTKYPMRRFQNFKASLKEGGNTVAVAKTVTLDLDFGLDGDTYAIGSNGFRSAINEGTTTVGGKVTLFFTNPAILNKAMDNVISNLEISVANGDEKLTITLPKVLYERTSPSIDGPKGVMLDMAYKAFIQDTVADNAITVTLINKHETYA